jgi:hypothetical protein
MMTDLVEEVARAMALIDDPHGEGKAWPNWIAEAKAARAIIRPDVLEEAAQVAVTECSFEAPTWTEQEVGKNIAAAIRALGESDETF